MTKTIFEESGFVFHFAQNTCVEKADAQNVTGMKSVDFIVETKTYYLYIEIKNFINQYILILKGRNIFSNH
ncbi:MAG: hypothetical protein LBP87_01220 [Planctomycetaceae bacterium]|jgi:hypothetical protein|nr:hypothetical protein [Planctomycetaceae bacterium]